MTLPVFHRCRSSYALAQSVALILTALFASAATAGAQPRLKTDRTRYAAEDVIQLTAEIPAGARPSRPLLTLTASWEPAGSRQRVLDVDVRSLMAGNAVRFAAPVTAGEWIIRLFDIGNREPIAVASFQIGGGTSAASSTTAARGGGQTYAGRGASKRGAMMISPAHDPVLGELFTVRLSLPPRPSGTSRFLRWVLRDSIQGYADTLKQPGRYRLPYDVQLDAGPDGREPDSVPVIAPFYRPGAYELALYEQDAELDLLPVTVTIGETPGALRLTRKFYRPGDSIEVTLKFPRNRYYYGQWSGPTIIVRPIEIGDRTLTPEERDEWNRTTCHCAVWLGGLARDTTAKRGSPNDGGVVVRSDTAYTVHPRDSHLRDVHSLLARREPGLYEVVFYDRGFPFEWKSFDDLIIDRVQLTVEENLTSPSVLQFVRQVGQSAYQAVTELTHNERFFLEARFETVPGAADSAQRTATVEWVDQGTVKSMDVLLTLISAGLYRSVALTLAAPMEPRRTTGRP